MPLPEPVPEPRALDLLVSVADLGSISAAAAAHGVTQPAASMRLRSLERLLGITLLERATTGTRLTPAGSATVEWASTVLDSMRTLLAGTAALRADGRSHLRLAASMTVAEYLLPRWLQQLSSEMPETRVSLEMGNTAHVCDLVARRQVDLGFVEGPRPPGYMSSREILADELVIVVARGHPWSRRRAALSPGKLAATPLVLRETGSGTRDVLTEALAVHSLEPTPAIELGSTTAVKAAAAGGVGPAAISALAVRSELESGQLVSVPYRDLSLRRVIRAIWVASRPPAAAATCLMAIARREKVTSAP